MTKLNAVGKSGAGPVRKPGDSVRGNPAGGGTTPELLIVDDDSAVLESLRRVFVQEGMRVTAVRSGEEAIEQLEHMHPDLIITDLRMGAVSGWDLVFHHHLQNSGLPFFVVTGLSLKEAGGVEKFAVRYFQKPLDLEELLQAVRDHVGSFRSSPTTAGS